MAFQRVGGRESLLTYLALVLIRVYLAVLRVQNAIRELFTAVGALMRSAFFLVVLEVFLSPKRLRTAAAVERIRFQRCREATSATDVYSVAKVLGSFCVFLWCENEKHE